jgi:hypothetical protein
MATWEYQSFLTNGPGMEEALNKSAREGWELVTVTATTYRYEDAQASGVSWAPTQWGAIQYRVVMKRQAMQAG